MRCLVGVVVFEKFGSAKTIKSFEMIDYTFAVKRKVVWLWR